MRTATSKFIRKDVLKIQLYRLDWIKILNDAITSRKTSWSQDPVIEWRNAGDTICFAVCKALEEKGIIPKFGEDLGFNKQRNNKRNKK